MNHRKIEDNQEYLIEEVELDDIDNYPAINSTREDRLYGKRPTQFPKVGRLNRYQKNKDYDNLKNAQEIQDYINNQGDKPRLSYADTAQNAADLPTPQVRQIPRKYTRKEKMIYENLNTNKHTLGFGPSPGTL